MVKQIFWGPCHVCVLPAAVLELTPLKLKAFLSNVDNGLAEDVPLKGKCLCEESLLDKQILDCLLYLFPGA